MTIQKLILQLDDKIIKLETSMNGRKWILKKTLYLLDALNLIRYMDLQFQFRTENEAEYQFICSVYDLEKSGYRMTYVRELR